MVVAAEADAGSQGDNNEVVVDLSGLASAWENDKTLRRHILRNKSLLTWICPKSVGVVTMRTLKLNTDVLLHLLRCYLPQAPVNKTCPVEYIYPEVKQLRGNIGLPEDMGLIHCDKKLQELFEFVILYWPPKPRKKKQAQEVDAVEDLPSGEAASGPEDEAADDGDEDGEPTQAPLADAIHDSSCDSEEAVPLDDGLMNDNEIRDGLLSSMGLHYGSPPPPSAFCTDSIVPETSSQRAATSLLNGLSDDPME
ncbi:hypothetical protein AK812_SmicGene46514, partial [Symbiodinium microadriaticum]